MSIVEFVIFHQLFNERARTFFLRKHRSAFVLIAYVVNELASFCFQCHHAAEVLNFCGVFFLYNWCDSGSSFKKMFEGSNSIDIIRIVCLFRKEAVASVSNFFSNGSMFVESVKEQNRSKVGVYLTSWCLWLCSAETYKSHTIISLINVLLVMQKLLLVFLVSSEFNIFCWTLQALRCDYANCFFIGIVKITGVLIPLHLPPDQDFPKVFRLDIKIPLYILLFSAHIYKKKEIHPLNAWFFFVYLAIENVRMSERFWYWKFLITIMKQICRWMRLK